MDFDFSSYPGVQWAVNNGAQLANANSIGSGQSNSGSYTKPFGPAPDPIDTSRLQALQNQVQRQAGIKSAMKDYDALAASTQAQGFQAANNAGASYGNRLMQAGINPTSAGVVAAQSKMPVYQQLAAIEKEKSTTRLDAINKSQSLAAQIAAQIAQIQLGYTKTLADYNMQQSQYEFDTSKFNLASAEDRRRYDQDYALKLASLNGGGVGLGGSGSKAGLPAITGGASMDYFPGYITNSGPIIPARGNLGDKFANGNNVIW